MENRKTKGRQKIPMQKIETRDDMLSTFSKRKVGMYKKAIELCHTFDVDIGIVIFSPSEKPHTFFHPSMDSVVARVLNPSQQLLPSQMTQTQDAYARANVNHLYQMLGELKSRARAEMERETKIDQMLEEQETISSSSWWGAKPVEECDKEELTRLTSLFENMRLQILRRIIEIQNGASSSSSSNSFGADAVDGNISLPSLNIQPPESLENYPLLPYGSETVEASFGTSLYSSLPQEPFAFPSELLLTNINSTPFSSSSSSSQEPAPNETTFYPRTSNEANISLVPFASSFLQENQTNDAQNQDTSDQAAIKHTMTSHHQFSQTLEPNNAIPSSSFLQEDHLCAPNAYASEVMRNNNYSHHHAYSSFTPLELLLPNIAPHQPSGIVGGHSNDLPAFPSPRQEKALYAPCGYPGVAIESDFFFPSYNNPPFASNITYNEPSQYFRL